MPVRSKAQARYLFSQAPDAMKPASKAVEGGKLPERVAPKGSQKNKPVTSAFKKKNKPLASYE